VEAAQYKFVLFIYDTVSPKRPWSTYSIRLLMILAYFSILVIISVTAKLRSVKIIIRIKNSTNSLHDIITFLQIHRDFNQSVYWRMNKNVITPFYLLCFFLPLIT
jgi:hypothetical protein